MLIKKRLNYLRFQTLKKDEIFFENGEDINSSPGKTAEATITDLKFLKYKES